MAFQTLPDNKFRFKSKLLAVVITFVCFMGLCVRLLFLMILQNDFLVAKAAAQQLRDTVIPAERGEIYSADGQLLATNASCWTVRASPREIQEDKIEIAAVGVSRILETDEQKVLTLFNQRSSNDCLLRQRIDRTMADELRDFCEENEINGIFINQDTKRYYPEGEFLASVMGFTNVDNVGVLGVELEYDEQLAGVNGLVQTAANAWGYTLEKSYVTSYEAEQGNDLVLTIDANIQHYLENALSYSVDEHSVAARAVGIAMDVNTGAILAMATTPSYDPNQPRVIYDDETRAELQTLDTSKYSEALMLAQQTQWRNKAVSDLYEPGSVFKLITASGALDSGAVSMNDHFVCGKHISVAGTRFHCANNKVHGSQDLTHALMNSCNQSFIQIGARLGKDDFFKYFENFGLTTATGVDLPGEIKKSEYYTPDRMGPVELASVSFGQSSKISYLQMITAVSAVVNGGKLLTPYVLQEISDQNGNVIHTAKPKVKHQVISEETSLAMREMMQAVVDIGGGRNAQIEGYAIGGKSGTSQKLDSDDPTARISSFVSVAPMNDPKIAVLICLDEPHSWTTSGSGLSAPVCAQVIEQTLSYWGIEPTAEETLQAVAIIETEQ